ncbi:DUF3857 domain-containing protein [Hanstruepera flava]|uniref:DUF3857 domain-containing protein n=1 Tax=Hanstruepera flava TaxID=2930218 RepID=UPI002027D0B0|nr:DUF3857 domain-containing protein [Hanstruepera flava]
MPKPTNLLVFFAIICFHISIAQESALLISDSIPFQLKIKANSVVRQNKMVIEIKDYNHMVVNNNRIITVFNKYGDSDIGTYESYSNNVSIRNLEARVYDAKGNEIKKFKEKDFIDESAVDGISLYSDNRVKYLDYTPINYPYTIVYESEVDYRTTAFLPSWYPIEGYYSSTQNAEYQIINNSSSTVKIKTENFEDYKIEKLNDFHYKASNLMSIAPESYSPPYKTFAPNLKAALTEFDMEGVKGVNNNWTDFGQWMNDKLITGTQELPETVKTEINALTASATTNLEKAKIVYEYMQSKTRYISVQVGIGGWKPMYASDVDRLGYGDCKALTNYTKSLLDEVGVPSYYTIIYGDEDIRNIDKEFSATQGNHAILCLPNNGDYVWLECTSQTVPFGYIANFTDDRDALIITPKGGEIVHTTVYKDDDNILNTKATVELDASGNIVAEVNLESLGSQYRTHERLLYKTHKDQELYYKEYWDYINNLAIISKSLTNDKDNVVFTENVSIEGLKYATKAGNRLLLQPNIFNRVTKAPPRYKKRKLPVEVDRGFVDYDEFTIKLPSSIQVEALQDDISISNKFGEYEFSVKQINENELLFKRKFLLKKGNFPREDYKDFRAFWLKVIKYDKSKIALIQKS